MDVERIAHICEQIRLELEANSWLQEELLMRLRTRAGNETKIVAPMEALVKGRTFRPCLSHLYLLRFAPFSKGALDVKMVRSICEETNADHVLALHYYQTYAGQRFPRPLIRSVLRRSVSNGSAESIIGALIKMGFATAVPCDRGRNNVALLLHDELFALIDKWITKKTGK